MLPECFVAGIATTSLLYDVPITFSACFSLMPLVVQSTCSGALVVIFLFYLAYDYLPCARAFFHFSGQLRRR